MKVLLYVLLFVLAAGVCLLAAGLVTMNLCISRKAIARRVLIGADPVESGKQGTEWLTSQGAEILSMRSADGLLLKGYYLANPQSDGRLAVVVHGYGFPSPTMVSHARVFYDDGYDVFMPDNRAHGLSEGRYAGMGYLEERDLESWLELLAKRCGEDARFVLFGISMGGAAVMMASARPLPGQVKCVIEDCGYTSALDEFAYQMKVSYRMPPFPLLPVADRLSKLLAGYRFRDADALGAVRRSRLPILFIHGDSDRLVPTRMGRGLYEAAACEKELVIFEGARHGESLTLDPQRYTQAVLDFLRSRLS